MQKEKHDKAISYVYTLLEKEEKKTKTPILLKDEFNLKPVPLKNRLDGNITTLWFWAIWLRILYIMAVYQLIE